MVYAKRHGGAITVGQYDDQTGETTMFMVSPTEARRLAAQLVIASGDPSALRGIEQTAETVREGREVFEDAKSVFATATKVAQRAQRILQRIERGGKR